MTVKYNLCTGKFHRVFSIDRRSQHQPRISAWQTHLKWLTFGSVFALSGPFSRGLTFRYRLLLTSSPILPIDSHIARRTIALWFCYLRYPYPLPFLYLALPVEALAKTSSKLQLCLHHSSVCPPLPISSLPLVQHLRGKGCWLRTPMISYVFPTIYLVFRSLE